VGDRDVLAVQREQAALAEVAAKRGLRVRTYGTASDDYRVSGVRPDGFGTRFTIEGRGEVRLAVPGAHNALNATAVVAVADALGLPFEEIRDGLAAFTGAKRRFEAKGEAGGVAVFDSYAHHPTELAADLRAARDVVASYSGDGRVIAVFQPHLYSRTVLAGGLVVAGLGFLVLFAAPLVYGWVALALLLIGAGMGSLAIASAVIMSGAPLEKAGSAAAIEETSYEVGGVLGVAVLGSVASAVYRTALPYTGAQADVVRESIGGALDVAATLGAQGARLAEQAKVAFGDSIAVTGAVGAALMLLAAAAVWKLTPRTLDIGAAHH
ncbi:cyanophycin synthetase, partial [Nonomuraea sp. NPDC055795]